MAKNKTEILKLKGTSITNDVIEAAINRAFPQKTFNISKRREVYDVIFDKPITLNAAIVIARNIAEEYSELHEYSNRIFIKF